MSVSVDTVYKTLQTIIDKEKQGHVTPTEFNLLANNVQNEIFREYFEEENRDKVRGNANLSGSGYSNLPFNQRQKIDAFLTESEVLSTTGTFALPSDLYLIVDDGVVSYAGNVVEEAESSMTGYLANSLVNASANFPYYQNFGSSIKVFPTSINNVTIKYLKTPSAPNWTYTVVMDQEMYDPSNASLQDFELHESEFSNIVIRMLLFFGINLREGDVIKVAELLKDKNYVKDNQ